MQTAIELLRDEFETAHEWLRETIADLTDEQARWQPPGIANPIGATLGHVLSGEDAMFSIVLQGAEPLFASTWLDKTGMTPLHPAPGQGDVAEWARSVKIELAALRGYNAAVASAAKAYLAKLDEAEYDRAVEFPGLPAQTVGHYLATAVLTHLFLHTGEIACLKGLQGQRGYNV